MRTLIISIAALILVLLIGGGIWYFSLEKEASPSAGAPPTAFPIGNELPDGQEGQRQERAVTLADGSTTVVYDFTANGITVPDPVNPGSYVLAGELGYCLEDGSCPNAGSINDFSIVFSEADQAFTVTLLAEPVGATRLAAEQYLLTQLGLPKEQACALRYHIGVPYWVNESFTGRNLGFSFCPGAIKLP